MKALLSESAGSSFGLLCSVHPEFDTRLWTERRRERRSEDVVAVQTPWVFVSVAVILFPTLYEDTWERR